MKLYWLIGCLIFNLVNAFSQEKIPCKIQSATIYYFHRGSVCGISVLYIDEFGARKAIHTIQYKDESSGEIRSEYYELYINDSYNLEDLMAQKKLDPSSQTLLVSSIINIHFTQEMLIKLGFVRKGEYTIAQKNCSLYVNNLDTICLWNGIVLKSSMHLSMVNIGLEAVRIDLSPPLDSVFKMKLNFK